MVDDDLKFLNYIYFYIIDLQSNIVICLIDISIEGFFPM